MINAVLLTALLGFVLTMIVATFSQPDETSRCWQFWLSNKVVVTDRGNFFFAIIN